MGSIRRRLVPTSATLVADEVAGPCSPRWCSAWSLQFVAHRLIDRLVRRAEEGVLPDRLAQATLGRNADAAAAGLDPAGAARQDDGQPAQEHHVGRDRRDHLHDDAERARVRHRADARQRRHHRRRARLRLPDPGQGLPVGHLHDLRGPVRRRRRREPRRGPVRDRRGREPARHPAPRHQRHGLVRPQRRAAPGRQHEPELGPRRARRPGQLARGPRPRTTGAHTRSRTTSGATTTSTAS